MNELLTSIYCETGSSISTGCARNDSALDYFTELLDLAMDHGRAKFHHSRESLLAMAKELLGNNQGRRPELEKLSEQVLRAPFASTELSTLVNDFQAVDLMEAGVEGHEIMIKVMRVKCCVCGGCIDLGAAGARVMVTTPRKRVLHPDCYGALLEKYANVGGPGMAVVVEGVPDDWVDFGVSMPKAGSAGTKSTRINDALGTAVQGKAEQKEVGGRTEETRVKDAARRYGWAVATTTLDKVREGGEEEGAASANHS
ncbi:hypothetical protein LTR17_015392 [Elasticomyces elasticus]|nr:hypothetical protein LTR17_015392 [Elasticomyces elasticus]